MSESTNKRLIKTFLVSGLGTLIGYAISFLLTPYITKNLGIEAYGFVTIANTAVLYAGIITIALTSFVVRYISIYYHKGIIDEAKEYYSSSIIACVVLSATLFGLSLLFIWHLNDFLNIPETLVSSVKLLFLIVFLNFVVTTITTPYSSSYYIRNRLDILGTVRLIAKIVEAIVIFVLFFLFPARVWYIAGGALLASILILVASRTITKKATPELVFYRKDISTSKIKNLLKNGVWNSLNQLGNVLNSGLDLIVSNRMLSGIETGQIAVGKTIGTYFSTLIQIISQPFEPILLKSYASGRIDLFLKDVSKAMKVCGFFGAVFFAGFFAVGKDFYKLWLPSENFAVLHVLTILTLSTSVTDSILRPVYYISTLTVKNKVPCWITIVGGILNVVSMYLLLRYTTLGVYAVVLTTTVIMFAINMIFNPLYAAKCINISCWFFYKILIRHLLSTIVLSLVFWWLNKLVPANNWAVIIAEAIVLSAIGAIIYFFFISTKEERRVVYEKIKSKLVKKTIEI